MSASPSPYDTYTSPLATRNASPEMLRLWSARHKFNTWRKIWLAVAEAQHELTAGGVGNSEGAPGGSRGSGGQEASSGQGASGAQRPPASAGGSFNAGSSQGGLPPLVTKEQVEELRAVVNRPGGITDEEMKNAERYERELRHDVMAHVHALGDSCPKAKGIIHLGMTSEDVGSNADLLILEEAFKVVTAKTARLIARLATFADTWRAVPTLGFTHYQPAQPITVGRRAAQWAYDLSLSLDDSHWRTKLRGLRGATGTQASFLALCNNDQGLVDRLEAEVVHRLRYGGSFLEHATKSQERELERLDRVIANAKSHWDPARVEAVTEVRSQRARRSQQEILKAHESFLWAQTLTLVPQTYPRVTDAFFISDLASVASVLHKIATDIRLLCNRKELDEPFEDKQIGSSAMPYKRNPMRCERICGLTRFVMNLVGNAYDTAATQWLERTLDDSSNRRLSLPEAFLALDGALDLMHNVASGLIVHEAMVRKNLMAELPFMATENLLMACVKLGADRQEYHEVIRRHAQAAGLRVKQEGLENDLLDRLKADKHFWSTSRGGPLSAELDWDGLLDPMKYVGRSVEQTDRFIREVVQPLREQYGEQLAKMGETGPRV